jgi:hypothetical protein
MFGNHPQIFDVKIRLFINQTDRLYMIYDEFDLSPLMWLILESEAVNDNGLQLERT